MNKKEDFNNKIRKQIIKDLKYLNDSKFYIKDRYQRYNNYTLINPLYHKKIEKKGLKSFISFINNNKPLFIDYYNRFNDIDFYRGLNNTFKEVYKILLSNNDIEKINKNFLFFKNNLTLEKNVKISIIRYDEFLKNIKIKKSYGMKEQIDKYFFEDSYKKYNYLLSSFIVLVEILTFDNKLNILYTNKVVKNDFLEVLKKNKVKYYKSSNDKLLKDIKNNKFNNLSYEDKKQLLLKNLKKSLKIFNNKSKKLDFLKKELQLEEKNKNKKRYKKLEKKFNLLLNDYHKIFNHLINLNNDLILLDKKEDSFLSNVEDTKINYSLKLKSYL